MKSEYSEKLHGLQMSEEAKEALIDTLTFEIEKEQCKRKIVQIPIRKKRMYVPFKVAAAFVVCILMGSGVAYAVSPYVSVSDAVDAVFRGAPANSEIVNSVGVPVGAAISNGGITISADAIIGDGQSYSIIYSVTFDEGISEEVQTHVSHLVMEGNSFVYGAHGMAGSARFYDDDPTDNTVYYLEQTFIDSGESVVGRTCTADFERIVIASADLDEPMVVAEGGWTIRFTINYEDKTVEFSRGQSIKVGGVEVAVTSLKLSPTSATVEFDAPCSDSRDVEADALRQLEQIGLMTVYAESDQIVTELDLSDCSFAATLDEGVVHCRANKTFDRIIDVDQITHVRIGGVAFESSETS